MLFRALTTVAALMTVTLGARPAGCTEPTKKPATAPASKATAQPAPLFKPCKGKKGEARRACELKAFNETFMPDGVEVANDGW